MPPLKILIIGSLPGPIGGTTLLLQQLVKELLERPDLTLYVINTAKARGTLKRIINLARICARILLMTPRADIVSVHASNTALSFLVPLVVVWCLLCRRRWILRIFGGSLDIDYRCTSFWRRRLMAFALQHASAVFVETLHLVHFLAALSPPVRTVIHYVNSRPFADSALRDRRLPLQVAFISQMKWSKGVGEILAACRLPGDYQVDLYGPMGYDVNPKDLDAARAVYRGVVGPDDVVKTLRQYDVLVLPTYWEGEGYPGAIIEAYSCGLPVVATRWGAIPEIVADGFSGLLVPPRDVSLLHAALQRLATESGLLERLRIGAARVFRHLSSEATTRQFVEICQALHNGRPLPVTAKQVTPILKAQADD